MKVKAGILEVYESLLRPRVTHHALMQFSLLRVLLPSTLQLIHTYDSHNRCSKKTPSKGVSQLHIQNKFL